MKGAMKGAILQKGAMKGAMKGAEKGSEKSSDGGLEPDSRELLVQSKCRLVQCAAHW